MRKKRERERKKKSLQQKRWPTWSRGQPYYCYYYHLATCSKEKQNLFVSKMFDKKKSLKVKFLRKTKNEARRHERENERT